MTFFFPVLPFNFSFGLLPASGFYPAVEEEAKKTNLASIGVPPTPAALSACQPTLREVLDQFGRESALLATAAREVLQVLFPYDKALPKLLSRLADRLAEALKRVLELQESAARGGAQWALSLLLSWYPDVDLEVFNEGPRAGMSYSELSRLDGVHRAASTIAKFVDFDEFIPSYEDPKGKTELDEGVEEGDKADSSCQPDDE